MSEDKKSITLSVKDLADAANYIDIAFKRGAFGAGEASEISALYAKFVEFVNITVEQQKTAQEAVESVANNESGE